jgi:ribonuclease BN (tRNA processing enzyme)
VELIVLGASGTWPEPGTATSGYLVRHDRFNVWVDAGTGTLANLQRHIELAELDAILISHEHPDHIVDLYPCFYARHYGRLGDPHLPVYAPSGFPARAEELVSEESRTVMRDAFDWHEVSPGERFEVGPFSVRTEPMSHLGLVALGFRLETDGTALAYTGDTGPTSKVHDLGRNTDVLLSEATWQDSDELLPFHLSARQAAVHAREAGVGLLILTHIWPTSDKGVSQAQAAEEFNGPIELATEGLRHQVGE